jgi:hypothetical protein
MEYYRIFGLFWIIMDYCGLFCGLLWIFHWIIGLFWIIEDLVDYYFEMYTQAR